MKHCYYFSCAMNESSSIEEAASQPLFLCPVCLRKLKKMLRFDIFQRYDLLRDALGEMMAAIMEDEGSSHSEAEVRAIPEQTAVFREEREGVNSDGVCINRTLSVKAKESSGMERLQQMQPSVQNTPLMAGASPHIAELGSQAEHVSHNSQSSVVHQVHGTEQSVVKSVACTGRNDEEVSSNYSNQLLQALQWLDRARESCAQTSARKT